MKIESDNDTYEIGKLVAKNRHFRVRECVNSKGRELLFQVAVEKYDSKLSRNAWVLTRLKQQSDDIEKTTDEFYNYDLGFPELVDEFVLKRQGHRKVNVVGFREVPKLESVIPLIKFWKNSTFVDLRTSAWIFGKLLKIISFAHSNRIEINKITGNNILIEPDKHYVIVFDWSDSVIHPGDISLATTRNEIREAAKACIRTIGNLDKAAVDKKDQKYVQFLRSLSVDGASSAFHIHEVFYKLVDSLCEDPDSMWKPGFHKFTTHTV